MMKIKTQTLQENNVTLDFDTIDKVIEQIKTVAIKRY